MAIQRKKLNIAKARRRVRMRSALLLTLGVCLVMSVMRALWAAGLPGALGAKAMDVLDMLLTLLCFGGGAYLGLRVLDGDHSRIVPMNQLSRAQILWLALLGVLAVSPVTLVSDMVKALFGAASASAFYAPLQPAGFLQTIVKSVLLAPICEELFFRGYLLQALERSGKLRAAIVTSLCFALVHSLEGMAPLALFGMLLCLLTYRTGSLLAPVLLHMCYNLTLILIDHIGAPGLLMGWSLLSCIVRLAGCAAFMAVLKRAYTARGEQGTFALWEGGRLSRRELALVIAAGVLLIALRIMGG